MALAREESLLIVCRSLNAFVNRNLVVDGGSEPVDGVRALRVGDTLADLADQDERFGLHVIDTIVRDIFSQVEDAGATSTLPIDRIRSGDFATLGDLADELYANAT